MTFSVNGIPSLAFPSVSQPATPSQPQTPNTHGLIPDPHLPFSVVAEDEKKKKQEEEEVPLVLKSMALNHDWLPA